MAGRTKHTNFGPLRQHTEKILIEVVLDGIYNKQSSVGAII